MKLRATCGILVAGLLLVVPASLSACPWHKSWLLFGCWAPVMSPDLFEQARFDAMMSTLPDRQVLVVGGGTASLYGDPVLNAELYDPAYLFRGPRPVIDAVPAEISYGATRLLHVVYRRRPGGAQRGSHRADRPWGRDLQRRLRVGRHLGLVGLVPLI